MKRASWISVLAAGGLLVAGCSSGSGTASSSSTPSSSAAASSTAKSSAESDTTVAPAELDSQTTAWFETLCGGLGPAVSGLTSLEQTTQTSDAAKAQAAIVAALQNAGTAFGETATKLQAADPPTIDGGEQIATEVAAGLGKAGTELSDGAASLAAVDPTDQAALQAALSSMQTSMVSALSEVEPSASLDPSVAAAVAEIPACKALGS